MSLCNNTIIKTGSSPDGRYDAILFLRNCGATTGFIPEVSITRHGQIILNTEGNIFIGSDDATSIDITWASNKTLIVQYTISDQEPIQLQKTKIADIQIQYQLTQP